MRRARQITMLAALCLAIAGLTHIIRGQRLNAVSKDFKEFTIIRVEKSESRTPHPMQRFVLHAQRADGSSASGEIKAGEPEYPVHRYVWLVPERARAQVNDGLRAKSTLYSRDLPAPQAPAYDPKCGLSRLSAAASPVYKGESEVLGFKTVMIQTEYRTDAGESFVHTDWKAPDLDCVVLKAIEYRRDNTGNVTGHFEIQAVKITAGTPDPKLFEIPGEYAEKSPSLLYEAYIASSGIPDRPMSPSMRRRLEREDQKYFENHRAEGVK